MYSASRTSLAMTSVRTLRRPSSTPSTYTTGPPAAGRETQTPAAGRSQCGRNARIDSYALRNRTPWTSMATRRFESVPDTARPPLPEQPTSVSTSTASRLTRYALIGSPVAGKGTHAQAAAPVVRHRGLQERSPISGIQRLVGGQEDGRARRQDRRHDGTADLEARLRAVAAGRRRRDTRLVHDLGEQRRGRAR